MRMIQILKESCVGSKDHFVAPVRFSSSHDNLDKRDLVFVKNGMRF